jgi:DNA excision repair protein ERCC-2
MDEYRIPIRVLAEYAYRSGSIEAGFQAQASLAEGTKAHQHLQDAYGEMDRKEVPIAGNVEYRDIRFQLDGRCDGLLVTEDGVMIDEIKSTARSLDEWEDAVDGAPVHWAQAYCYAYLYAREEGLERIAVRLTYTRVGTEEVRRIVRLLTVEELAAFVTGLAAALYPYARMKLDQAAARDASARALAFPFGAYRPGQRRLAGAVYKAIADGKGLFAKAPTGTGKTISTLFPAIKAFGEGLLERVYYLTARTTQRQAAEDALARLGEQGLRMQTVTLTAKEKICFQDEVDCRAASCPYADGYYDRINAAVVDLLGSETMMTREVIESYARKHCVCPFEYSLDAAYAADAVICDYNYIFDPRVSLKRQFEEQKRRTALLVDEAHNLEPRAREMFSAALGKGMFLELQRAWKGVDAELHGAAKAMNAAFIALRKQAASQTDARLDEGVPEPLAEAAKQFAAAAERRLAAGGAGGAGQGAGQGSGMAGGGETAEVAEPEERAAGTTLLDAYFAVQTFLRAAAMFDERFVAYAESDRREFTVKLLCLDPSELLRKAVKGYRSRVYFSATLSPLPYYIERLGGDDEDYAVSVPSPFEPAQWDVRIVPLSTRYRDRAASIAPIAALLAQAVRERPGNHLAFFPSYAYMNEVHEAYMAIAGGVTEDGKVDVLLQSQGMSDEERGAYLEAFQAGRKRSLLGFAVMGGIFSEGVDLQGDRLSGVAVIGVGLPQPSAEREWIRAYFDATGKDGFDYAYVYPGMNKVLQAGGRLIRSEEDRGTLLLIDDRYRQPKYWRLLPPEWREGQGV